MANKVNPTKPATAASSNNSQTEAGQVDLVDAINQAFELLRINYHHLYFSAYNEVDALNAAKRLWLNALESFEPATILAAVSELIKTSDYLPTVSKMVSQCQTISDGPLPSARSAYIEACRAPSPKTAYNWSHPLVYFAGRDSDWYFIANNPERVAFPVFRENYERLKDLLAQGHTLPAIEQLALPEETAKPLSKKENAERMQTLIDSLD